VSPAFLLALVAAACPARAPAPGSPGVTAVAKLPAEEAMKQNAEGKRLYRQGRWAEARAKYRAALAADPDFLDAQLNIACSFSREGRYGDATDEAIKLVRAAYVPWQREVREAADLGILQDQTDYPRLVTASSEAAAAWGEAVGKGIFFVARTKPPVNVAGEGLLVLRRNQEIFSWNPETGRYFQVTAEDGRVLGFVRSADGRRLAYVLGGKLIRERGKPELLRELSLRVLEIATMALGPNVAIPGDVVGLKLVFVTTPELAVTEPGGGSRSYRLGSRGLEEVDSVDKTSPKDVLVISGALGAHSGGRQVKRAGCTLDVVTKQTPGGLWQIEVAIPSVATRSGKSLALDARYGAGLPGLSFFDGPPRPKAARAVQNDKK